MASDTRLYEEIVDALGELYGRREGHRAVHAKGFLCRGTFTAAPAARELSRAAHLQGEPVEATVRLSNGGGDPNVPDGKPDGRGMSIKMYLPDGSRTDIVALTLPVFFVRTPEDFLAFTTARRPDPETGKPDMQRMGAWLQDHPEAMPALQYSLSMKPPASYATLEYHAIHAFRWVAGDGSARHVRYRFVPEAGVETITTDEAKARDADYLRTELEERLRSGRVSFTLQVQVAEEGDPVDDPTAAWPEERELVDVGKLELTELETGREGPGDILVFDPTRVTDGVELTDDPILHARSRAYSVSVERRSGAPRPAVLA